MWLSRLDLLAFGRFTETRLTLGPGFHLIYGRNEAGKSTALRAIRQLLFGFDERTVDNFLHPNPNLRVGGIVCDHTGRELEVIRRKARKDSLRGPDDDSLIDLQQWRDLMCHIDADAFSQRYGINYEQLIEGGREIATGNGDLGEILFATGSGVSDLTTVQKRLADEAAELFRPLGKKQRLNQAISEWQQQRDDVVAKQLSVASWEETDRQREQVDVRLSEVSERLSRMAGERDRMRRQCAAKPLLQEQDSLEQKLIPLASVRTLPLDFSGRRQDARLLFNQIQALQQSATATHDSALKELNGLNVLVNVLDRANDLSRLFAEWGSFCKAQIDRPGLIDQREHHRALAAERLRSIGREAKDFSEKGLSLDRAQRTQVGLLGRQHSALQQAVEQFEQQLLRSHEQIESTRTQLTELPPPKSMDELRTLVRQALSEGDLETQLNKAQVELTLLQADAEAQRGQLGLWTGSMAELRQLDTPSSATIERFESEFKAIDAEQALLKSKLVDWDTEYNKRNQEIDRLRRDFHIPLQTDLTHVRAQRDAIWSTIRQQLVAGQIPSASVIQSYEACSKEADELGDLLRNEADRVAQLTEQLADQTALESRQHEVSVRLAELNAVRLQKVAAWQTEWRQFNIADASPRDMQTWLARRATLLHSDALIQRRLTDVNELRQKIAERTNSLSSHLFQDTIARVVPAPKQAAGRRKSTASASDRADQTLSRQQMSFGWDPDPGPLEQTTSRVKDDSPLELNRSLTSLLEQAEQQLNHDETVRRTRLALERELTRLQTVRAEVERSAEQARADLARWQEQWQAVLAGLMLDPETSPDSASLYVETLSDVLDHERQIEQLSERIVGIDSDSERFTVALRSICHEIAPDLIEVASKDVVSALRMRLSESQRDQLKCNEQEARKAHAEQQLLQAHESRARLRKELNHLCTAAAIDSPPQDSSDDDLQQHLQSLEEKEVQSQQRLIVGEHLDRVHQRLQELAQSQTLEDFLADLRLQPLDQLRSQLQQLEQASGELQAERDQLNHQLGGLDEQLRKMNGSADAAEAEENQRQTLARIQSDAEQFVRFKLASSVLQTAIERYREKTREPILRVASELFRELTLGAFTELRVDEQANKPVLVGLRADGRAAVTVDGMSEGTCDQLYLALRLASLQLEAAPRNRLPFIVDDILIQFDDLRAAAALRVLERFSENRQVIFFTHHEHLLEVAQKSLGGLHSIHRLGA